MPRRDRPSRTWESEQAGAARRDKQAYADALSEGKGRPSKREEPKVSAALEDAELRSEALKLAIDAALDERAKLLKTNHPVWRLRALRELARAKQRYQTAIEELAAARDDLSNEAALVGWLDGGAGVEAANDQLGGSVGTADGTPPLSFAGVVAELRRDGDAIAAHPATRHDPHPHMASEHVKVGALLGSQWGVSNCGTSSRSAGEADAEAAPELAPAEEDRSPVIVKLCNGCHGRFQPQEIKRGRCADCLRAYYRERGKTRARGYGGSWQRLSAAVLRRDGYRCHYCGERARTADHVVPKSKGGTDAMSNLVAACLECNSGKRDRVFSGSVGSDPPLGFREKNESRRIGLRQTRCVKCGTALHGWRAGTGQRSLRRLPASS